MNEGLKKRIFQALAASALVVATSVTTKYQMEDPVDIEARAIAGAMVTWHEGRKYVPYIDPVGILTVCEGITGEDVIRNKRYTDAECDGLREKHLSIAMAGAKRVVKTWKDLNRWQRAAVLDFTYNLGETQLRTSTLAVKLNQGDITGACAQLNRWVLGRVNGKLVPLGGLVARRDDETEICVGALGV